MTTIQLSQLRLGMVTATDIRDKSGRLLLKAQTPITDNRLTILKTWGIQQVQIQSDEPSQPTEGATPAPVSSNSERRAKELIQQRFELTDRRHEAMDALYSFCLDYCAKQLEHQRSRS